MSNFIVRYYDIKDPQHTIVEESFRTKDEADAFRRELQAAKREGYEYRILNSSAFENGRAKALAQLQNQAEFIGISYQGKLKKFTSEAEANKFTKELDKQGIDWIAQYSPGWR